MNEREKLEIQLLEAQIKKIEKENKRTFFREFLPSLFAALAAISFSIVASIVIILVGERVVEKAKKDLAKIESEIENKSQILSEKHKQYDELNSLLRSLAGKPMLYDLGVDFDIEIKKIGNNHTILAVTNNLNVQFKAYDMCKNTFVFPGGIPDTSICDKKEGKCTIDKNIKRCTFGPFFIVGNNEEGIWISADLEGKKIYRYAHIKQFE
jgi:hypothetical protein